jgi:hypothetical protein
MKSEVRFSSTGCRLGFGVAIDVILSLNKLHGCDRTQEKRRRHP